MGAVLGAVVLSACQPGPREDFVILSGATFRCGSGQSWVGEPADRDGAGNLPAWAGTGARRDLYCVNADGLGPAWNRLEARAELRKGSAICAVSSPAATYSAGDTLATTSYWCGTGSYRATGQHSARTVGNVSYSGDSGTGSIHVS